jgi:putative membrane protein
MRAIKDFYLLIAKGFCMGSADLVPGVSGGTMAFILGIYTRLLEAIRSFDEKWLKSIFRLDIRGVLGRPHFAFVIPLLLGIGLALFFFTRVIPLQELLISYPEMVYGLFFGLIVASIYVLMSEIEKFGFKDLLYILPGALFGFFVVTLVPVDTPDDSWFIFFCGLVAICAMVLPGISGSFILLILRKYAYIIGALGTLDFTVLIPFVLGCITGLVGFTRFLVWALHRWYRQMILVIKGILFASLWVIWPFQNRSFVEVRGKQRLIETTPVWPSEFSTTVMYSLLCAVIGVLVVVLIHELSKKKQLQQAS